MKKGKIGKECDATGSQGELATPKTLGGKWEILEMGDIEQIKLWNRKSRDELRFLWTISQRLGSRLHELGGDVSLRVGHIHGPLMVMDHAVAEWRCS